jgi:putative nucleotidyltransferase with HDIG domain
VARIGGDEFAIVMPKTTDLEAKRISSSIESTIYTENVLNIKLTLSCGYDTKLTMNQSLNEVIANADNFMYRHKIYEYSSAKSKTIDIILKALFEKSQREAEHSLRVGDLSEAIATELGLDHEVIIRTKAAGRVHDIGKIGINENILNKPTRLDDNEWSQIKRHPEIGWRILSASNEFFELANFVLNHHERWDGTGYPNGIKTESIPMESRIIALSDAFDAMTSDRSYRNQISVDQAIRVIIECSGTQFDPRVVEAFLRFVDKSPNHLLITK